MRRIGRVHIAQAVSTIMRDAALRATIRPERRSEFAARYEVVCVKCNQLTTRRLDRDVGVHEACEP